VNEQQAPVHEPNADESQVEASAAELSQNIKPNKWRRRFGCLLFLFAGFFVFLTVFYLYHKPILRGMAEYLVYRSPLQKADIIVVLSGGGSIRLEKGIELYREGYAPRLMITIPYEPPNNAVGFDGLAHEIREYKAVLQLHEVDEEQVVWSPQQFFSTYSEGLYLQDWLNRHNLDSAIVVTGHFQARRAKWTMEHIFNEKQYGIMIVPADNDNHFTTNNWWTYAYGFITVENEYMKLIYYRIKGLFGRP